MRVKCVVTSFGQVAAMVNVHRGLAARITRILLRGNCCLEGISIMAEIRVGKSQVGTWKMANRIRVIENVYGI